MELTYAKSRVARLTMTGARFKRHIFVLPFTYIQRDKQTGNYLRRTRSGIRICFAADHSLRTQKQTALTNVGGITVFLLSNRVALLQRSTVQGSPLQKFKSA